MGIARGTNIVKDGLIYGYDTGYGVADPGASTRFYKGKPTTNIASGAAFIHDTASGSAGSCVDAPEKGPGWKKVTITAIGTNFRVVQFGSYPSLTANITYSSSFEADWGNMRGKGYVLVQDGSGGGTRNTFKNGSYATGVTSNIAIDSTLLNGHVGMNIIKTANHVHVPFIYNSSNTSTSGRNDYFYYKEYQQEVGTIPTPYVSGARSSTASLIDLKRTVNIDVSNISFDSAGQPDFDGTDDYIPLASNLQNGDSAGSWEFVVNFDECHNDDTSTYRQIYIQESSVWIAQYYDKIGIDMHKDNGGWFDGNGGLNTSSQIGPVVKDTWYHGIFTFDQGVIKGYLNGVLGFTTTQSGMSSIKNGATHRNIGRRSNNLHLNGELPVFKLYDKALSQAEVTQNYKAYKNRFNI